MTVKIRKGFDENRVSAVEIAKIAEDCGVAAIAVHGRTREQYYSGLADWDIIAQVKQAVRIPVIGNGDVDSPQAAKAMLEQTGCDGVMIGRAAQGNPWIFRDTVRYLETGGIPEEADSAGACESAAEDKGRVHCRAGDAEAPGLVHRRSAPFGAVSSDHQFHGVHGRTDQGSGDYFWVTAHILWHGHHIVSL